MNKRVVIYSALAVFAVVVLVIRILRPPPSGEEQNQENDGLYQIEDQITYESLEKDGIVPGFKEKTENPLSNVNRIRALVNPPFVKAAKGLYSDYGLMIGHEIEGNYYFAPVAALNLSEIAIYKEKSLCFSPISGLAFSLDKKMLVSGLLKYDTSVLVDADSKQLFLPYQQQYYNSDTNVGFNTVQLIYFKGVYSRFPNSFVIDPTKVKQGNPYAKYALSRACGFGHPRPGLERDFLKDVQGHPKEIVILAGFEGKIQKGYRMSRVKKRLGEKSGFFKDKIGDKEVVVHYEEEFQWIRIEHEGKSINTGYSYAFALYLNLPNIPVF